MQRKIKVKNRGMYRKRRDEYREKEQMNGIQRKRIEEYKKEQRNIEESTEEN